MAKHNTYMWTGYLKNWLQPVFCSPVSSCHLSFLFRSGFGLVALFENQTKPDFKTLAFGHKWDNKAHVMMTKDTQVLNVNATKFEVPLHMSEREELSEAQAGAERSLKGQVPLRLG